MNRFKYVAFILLFVPLYTFASDANTGTANDFSTYVPYAGLYGYGSNMGYYGTHLTDQDVAQLAYNAGSRTIRLPLPDWLITGYGINARKDAFTAYQQMGMKDMTIFLGEPDSSNKDPNNAKIFKGLYEPIWLDSAKTQINPANTFAAYVYKTVSAYGANVKFWEIVNEPDFTYTSSGWESSTKSYSWWNVNPTPSELENLKAPVYTYVRELHIAWEVIKKLQPNSYIATGGIGYPSFLDAVLRNTDNPTDGSVSTTYPLKGGAYFDVLSFHSYPMYSLRHWDNSIGDFVYTRNSDAAAANFIQTKNDFETVLVKYGYNGSTYPKKQYISTETDFPQREADGTWGSLEAAKNFITKVHVLAQINNVFQIYKYGLGTSGSDIFSTMGVYGDLSNPSVTTTNAPKTDEWAVVKNISDKLYGKTYDATKTAQLNLPANILGGAFRDTGNNYMYVLWAKTTIDKSENASASYTFAQNGQTVSLTGTPTFVTLNSVSQNTTQTYVPPVTTYYTQPVTYYQQAPTQTTYIPTNSGLQGKSIVIASKLNVRKTPGGKIFGAGFMGNKVTVVEQTTLSGYIWKKVIFDTSGMMGWVAGRYVRDL